MQRVGVLVTRNGRGDAPPRQARALSLLAEPGAQAFEHLGAVVAEVGVEGVARERRGQLGAPGRQDRLEQGLRGRGHARLLPRRVFWRAASIVRVAAGSGLGAIAWRAVVVMSR